MKSKKRKKRSIGRVVCKVLLVAFALAVLLPYAVPIIIAGVVWTAIS